MDSITNTQETKPAATAGGGLSSVLGILGAGLGVVALAAAIYLFVELRDARKQIGALQARVGEVAATADKRTKELDLGLAGLRGQTAAVAEKAGVTAAELERTAATARQLRNDQRKSQESLTELGGEVGKVKDDVKRCAPPWRWRLPAQHWLRYPPFFSPAGAGAHLRRTCCSSRRW